jgi:hypothetical protein
MRTALPAALLAALASAVAAQQAAPPDPSNPAASAPKPVYESAFTGYRPWTEVKASPWREANEDMRRLGGHAGHVKPAAKAPLPPQKKAPK